MIFIPSWVKYIVGVYYFDYANSHFDYVWDSLCVIEIGKNLSRYILARIGHVETITPVPHYIRRCHYGKESRRIH